MSQLVGNNTGDFIAAQGLQQARGHGYRRMLGVTAGREGVRRVGLDPVDRDLRCVGGGDELVVEEVRVPLPPELVELRALGERLPDAHHDAAVDLAVGADAVQDPPAVVHRGDAKHPHDAGVAVDLDVRRVRDQLRRVERLEAEPSDAALGRRRRRRFGNLTGALPVDRPAGRQARDLHRLLGRSLHAHRAADELEVVGRRLEPLRGRVEQLVADVGRRREHRADAVERRLRATRAHVPRGRVRVLVEQREVLRLHPELLGDELRHRHHGAGAVLLRPGDDRPRAVRVELQVRARVRGEARPPAARDADRLVVGQLLVAADQLDRLRERLLHRDALEHLARGGHRAVLDQRSQP